MKEKKNYSIKEFVIGFIPILLFHALSIDGFITFQSNHLGVLIKKERF
jgi:hypothetical protein